MAAGSANASTENAGTMTMACVMPRSVSRRK
jgi:hypothetical protein